MPSLQRPELPLTRISTLYLRIPRVDWSQIRAGSKTELRMAGRGTPFLSKVNLPRPIVGYSMVRFRADSDQRLFVLEECWSEPLGAISGESLAREGFDSLADFRAYWRRRYRDFKPLTTVQVFRLRPWRETDVDELARKVLGELYGTWL